MDWLVCWRGWVSRSMSGPTTGRAKRRYTIGMKRAFTQRAPATYHVPQSKTAISIKDMRLCMSDRSEHHKRNKMGTAGRSAQFDPSKGRSLILGERSQIMNAEQIGTTAPGA